MLQQSAGRLPPLELPQSFETALSINGHVAVHRRLGDLGQARGLMVGQSLADEPQDFHPLLHSRMGVLKAFLVQGLLLFFRES